MINNPSTRRWIHWSKNLAVNRSTLAVPITRSMPHPCGFHSPTSPIWTWNNRYPHPSFINPFHILTFEDSFFIFQTFFNLEYIITSEISREEPIGIYYEPSPHHQHHPMKPLTHYLFGLGTALAITAATSSAAPILIDHSCTALKKIPESSVKKAKQNLHIVYGHTSHGSQLITGMSGLAKFTQGGGGPLFAWNNGGKNGALDLHDSGMGGDVGYFPKWVNETKKYLDNPKHNNVNVVIWSWCGQLSGLNEQQLIDKYLNPMSALEKKYPKVRFVYMTGHLNIGRHKNTKARNDQVRAYCKKNGKVLYDFADIESWNPDGKHFPYSDDACNYYDASKKKILGNWATEWQNSHKEGIDWYQCGSAHSKPLNANRKAYAAWWLWARLAGWKG